LLPKEAAEDAENDKEKIDNVVPHVGSNTLNGDANEGLPWFETILQGSKLGNMRRSWGSRESGDGRVKVEWEITEWNDEGENENTLPGKRKIGDVEAHNSHMEGAH
jgi:hypothetical protein